MADVVKNKKKNWFVRHKVMTVILAIIVIIILVNVSGGNKKDANTSTKSGSTASAAKKEASVAKLNQPVRDGKFEFTITAIKCGETSVGGQYLNKAAQGQYCRLSLSVKNIGNEAQSLDATSQYLFNAAGQKYSADSTATIYAASPDSSNSTWFANINPGNSVTGDVIFDIPKDQTPVTAELHDSAFSTGTKVSLQ